MFWNNACIFFPFRKTQHIPNMLLISINLFLEGVSRALEHEASACELWPVPWIFQVDFGKFYGLWNSLLSSRKITVSSQNPSEAYLRHRVWANVCALPSAQNGNWTMAAPRLIQEKTYSQTVPCVLTRIPFCKNCPKSHHQISTGFCRVG